MNKNLLKRVKKMKKKNKLFLAMCVAGSFALLFGSCKKNEEVKEVNINLPALEEEVDSRAYIDFGNNGQFMWNGNDEVVIYNLDQAGLTSQKAIFAAPANAQGRASTKFYYQSGDQITGKKYGYFMFYPVSKVSDGPLAEGNYETFTVDANQTYTLDPAGTPTVDPESMALAIDMPALSSTVSLKHIFGILKVRLTGTGAVTKIEVVDNRYNLAGSATMKLHEVKMVTFQNIQNAFVSTNDPDNEESFYGAWNAYKTTLDYSTVAGGNVMTLNCPTPVQLSSEETLFPISLRPGALKYGFTLKVYLDGSDTPLEFVNGGQASWNYGIKAGYMKNLILSVN